MHRVPALVLDKVYKGIHVQCFTIVNGGWGGGSLPDLDHPGLR